MFAALLAAAAIASVVAVPRALHDSLPVARFPAPRHRTGTSPPLGAAAVARNKAASWIRQWVSASAVVACDPQMCRALACHGVAAARMQQLSTNAEDPLGADVVVATPVIRAQFGARLAAVYAPGVLARFGTGRSRVDVRVVESSGVAVRYLSDLRADVRARRAAGVALLANPHVVATGAVARELAAGAVDARLLTNLATLAAWSSPVSVVSVGGSGPRATPGMPMLSVSVTPMLRHSGIWLTVGSGHPGWATMPWAVRIMKRAAARIMMFLDVQRTPLRPARCQERRLANGQIVIQIDFGAPTQFGVFGSSLAGTYSPGRGTLTSPVARAGTRGPLGSRRR